MIELNGKYGTAKVFADMVDSASISQIIELLNQPFAANSRVRMMPDVHAGAGCTIGTTMQIGNAVCPNLVGVDIGCGMLVAKLEAPELDLDKLDKTIRERIPCGFEIRAERHRYFPDGAIKSLRCRDFDLDRAEKSIGTLGGGNHFIEVDKGEDGFLYLVIHSGSRHLGVEIANYYQNKAYEQCNKIDKKQLMEDTIRKYTEMGMQRDIESALNNIRAMKQVPKALAYCTGQLFDDYIFDMQQVQFYAHMNRCAILIEIISKLNLNVVSLFETIHNYIDVTNMILRKGAVSATEGELLIIPMNMRDGSLICRGKGNPDWNFSAPHGAGRIMSRAQAKELFTVNEFKESMRGIYTTTVNRGTLDECPMAYKPIHAIVDNIGPTVDILDIIKPIYNFKASE